MKNSTKNGSSEMMIESGSDFSLVYRQWFGHQLWPALCTSYVWALPSADPLLVHQWRGGSHPGEVVSEIWVKSGEEWWRVVKSWANSSPLGNALFIGISEGWVKSEEYFMTPLFIQISESEIPGRWSCALISYGRFYCATWTANWQIWRQLAVLGKTVNCSSSAS